MQARLQLSIIDHNHNVGRQHACTRSGEHANTHTHTHSSGKKYHFKNVFVIIVLLLIYSMYCSKTTCLLMQASEMSHLFAENAKRSKSKDVMYQI